MRTRIRLWNPVSMAKEMKTGNSMFDYMSATRGPDNSGESIVKEFTTGIVRGDFTCGAGMEDFYINMYKKGIQRMCDEGTDALIKFSELNHGGFIHFLSHVAQAMSAIEECRNEFGKAAKAFGALCQLRIHPTNRSRVKRALKHYFKELLELEFVEEDKPHEVTWWSKKETLSNMFLK